MKKMYFPSGATHCLYGLVLVDLVDFSFGFSFNIFIFIMEPPGDKSVFKMSSLMLVYK